MSTQQLDFKCPHCDSCYVEEVNVTETCRTVANIEMTDGECSCDRGTADDSDTSVLPTVFQCMDCCEDVTLESGKKVRTLEELCQSILEQNGGE